MHVVIHTKSGSVYKLGRTNGRWWVSGVNVVNEQSKDIRGDKWEIERPAPTEIGMPLVFVAARSLAMDDPARMPGGGKVTSPVTSMELVR